MVKYEGSWNIEMIFDTEQQMAFCQKYGADFVPCGDHSTVGINRSFDALRSPLNGLRHRPFGQTNGWYIWSGEQYSDDPNFFVPLHTMHLANRGPQILKYLGLAPGWRFLLAPDYEDVWFDEYLLRA